MIVFIAGLLIAARGPAALLQDPSNLRPERGSHAEEQVVEHPPRVAPPMDALASQASADFDAVYYHLDLDVRFDPDYLYGSTRVFGTSTIAPLDTLVLDFGSNMQVDSVVATGGGTLSFVHAANALRIALAESAGPGDTIDVVVHYHGLPLTHDFGIFRFGRHANGDPFVWSLSEPYGAREWWPCKDHPSDKADSVRVTTTVPAPMQVASNGVELPSVDNGDGTLTYDWISRYPIATYLVSIAGGVYDVHRQQYERPDSLSADMGALDLPIVHYAYTGTTAFDGAGPTTGWRHVLDIMPLMEYWFGPYPFPEEKYGHAHATFGGGMEHQTISTMGGNGMGLIVHELAHQWFGDLITMETWPHLWLNEGFANYSELLWWDHVRADFPTIYDQVFNLYYDRALNAPGTLLVEDTLSIARLFDSRVVYAKGGMVLSMLRGMVGDETFRQILHAYAASEAFAYGTATTDDFRGVAEGVSGLDLGDFFRQWVTDGTGAPVYSARWSTSEEAGGSTVMLEIEQVQTAAESNVDVFVMPLTVAFHSDGTESRFVIQNDQPHQTYWFSLASRPDSISLDPDRQVLRRLHGEPVAVDPGRERPTLPMSVNVYPNPANTFLRIEVGSASASPVQVELFDMLGRRVREVEAAEPSLRLAVADLAAGQYLLRIESGGAVQTHAVSIVR